ncbi:MAG: SIS domain-containing protein, partial [Firmicutes bacterium]|nr:SIS domain-containing protein [Bacillota bacterium]
MYKDTILYKEILEQPKVLSKLLNDNQSKLKELDKQVKARNIQYIVTTARGSSGHACDYFMYLAEVFSKFPVKDLHPSIVTCFDGKVSLANALVIGVSQSGKAEDVLSCLKRAKQDGSIVVAITNNVDSPIAKIADFSFDCNAGLETSVAATKTFTASMYLLMLIVRQLSSNPQLQEIPTELIKGVESVIANAKTISEFGARVFKDTQDLFVVSRGFDFGIGKETALKLNESCYIKAMAFSSAEFQHGPYAMVDGNATVLAYVNGTVFDKELDSMVDKCRKDGAKVVVVSDKDKGADIIVPQGNAACIPFYNIVVAQILSNATSQAKGIDTDKPR